MKAMLSILIATGLAILCWGFYGPVLARATADMGDSSLRAFIGVGLAYFVIAVATPITLLKLFGETGHWSSKGILWSTVAGAAGAIGALGVILAMKFRGSPIYVMPLVFGGAPVVNTLLTMWLSKTYKQVSPVFIAGLIMVMAGSVTVLVFRPHGPPASAASNQIEADEASGGVEQSEVAVEPPAATMRLRLENLALVFLFTGMTALAFGAYGPTLHMGQSAMAGSRLRPFICVGLAYFIIAVIVPAILLKVWSEPGEFTVSGTFWSLMGGAAGAIGALGIILAFNLGGKPIYVMPLVFGGAPLINTFVSLVQSGAFGQIGPIFYAGLIVVVAGAVTVLVFAPRPGVAHAD